MNNEEIYKYLYDDCDSDVDDDGDDGGDDGGGCGGGGLDTQWINEMETQIICDDYSQFIKTNVTSVSFEFIYLNTVKEIVTIDRCVVPLMRPNAITQNEIFQLIQKKQRLVRKYYNFMCMCFYHFYIDDDPKSVSQYLYSKGADGDVDGDADDADDGNITEYTNILSIKTIYFQPLIRMFHDMNCFTVVLYED